MEKVLLLYNIGSPAYRKSIEEYCKGQEIRIRYVSPEEYDVPLGFVAYGSEKDCAEYIRKERGKEFGDAMMVFSGFTGDELFAFLRGLRVAGIGTTDLKAMLTEHNAVWDSLALCEELRKEHAYMKEMARKKQGKTEQKKAK